MVIAAELPKVRLRMAARARMGLDLGCLSVPSRPLRRDRDPFLQVARIHGCQSTHILGQRFESLDRDPAQHVPGTSE